MEEFQTRTRGPVATPQPQTWKQELVYDNLSTRDTPGVDLHSEHAMTHSLQQHDGRAQRAPATGTTANAKPTPTRHA
jgi:hypothetical protein